MLETCQNCHTPSQDVRDGKCSECRGPAPKAKRRGVVRKVVDKLKGKGKKK